MSTSLSVPYEKQSEIDKFKSAKASEDKILIPSSATKSSSKSKTNLITPSPAVDVLESSTDDVEMEISN